MKEGIVDFFVIGAARAGTTTWYHYLSQHPEIFLPNVKECNFFSEVASLDPEAYKKPKPGKNYHMKIINSLEGYQELFKNAGEKQLKGDVSPSYLWDLNTAKHIYNHNKNAKILVSLRNPIDRAYSHYLMHYQTGYEKEPSFEKALRATKNPIWGGGNSYLDMSLYYPQLQPYFNKFPASQIKILIYEDWIKSKAHYLNEIYTFLGLPSFSEYSLEESFNKTQALKNKQVLDFLRQEKLKSFLKKIIPDKATEKIKQQIFYKEAEKPLLPSFLAEELKQYFREDIKKTETLIQQPLTQKWNWHD